jgi:hypothetical protein
MPQLLLVNVFLSLMLAQSGRPVMYAQPSRWTLTVVNSSGFDIYHLYVSSSEIEEWGPDQLGNRPTDVLADGGRFRLIEIKTGEYDIKIVDQDGDVCVLRNIQIHNDEEWQITREDLLACEFH